MTVHMDALRSHPETLAVRLAHLRHDLRKLEDHRLMIECGDDFAFTNPASRRQLDHLARKISETRAKIACIETILED